MEFIQILNGSHPDQFAGQDSIFNNQPVQVQSPAICPGQVNKMITINPAQCPVKDLQARGAIQEQASRARLSTGNPKAYFISDWILENSFYFRLFIETQTCGNVYFN